MSAPRTRLRATEYAMRGLRRSSQSRKVSQASQGWSVRCAFAQAERPGGAIVTSSGAPTIRPSRSTAGRSASATSSSAKPKASTATSSRSGSASGIASCSSTAETRAKVSALRANQPVVSELGAWAIMPRRSSRPQVGRMP